MNQEGVLGGGERSEPLMRLSGMLPLMFRLERPGLGTASAAGGAGRRREEPLELYDLHGSSIKLKEAAAESF